jgi:hypothetical protein
MRDACFDDEELDSEKSLDGLPNQQLWRRSKTEIIEDGALFEDAPLTAIQKHFQAWIKQQGFQLPGDEYPGDSIQIAGSSTHRFCIIIDAEALRNLLRFPLRATADYDLYHYIGVNVFDEECHAGSSDYPPPFDGGWLWTSPRLLPNIWFECPLLPPEKMRGEDNLGRPVAWISRAV